MILIQTEMMIIDYWKTICLTYNVNKENQLHLLCLLELPCFCFESWECDEFGLIFFSKIDCKLSNKSTEVIMNRGKSSVRCLEVNKKCLSLNVIDLTCYFRMENNKLNIVSIKSEKLIFLHEKILNLILILIFKIDEGIGCNVNES